ncbi:sirohydrochlorin chelatase [Paenibacillus flagellatus]|uniref:Cobalamin biosynthesis protein CbiX n=1 Tax=Paenibacillus flagellatus TaxID=2211139 RepID=A0A2V5KNT6_9BACL|nr:CbiX/SirB N-terminal domain-containing protein [Paenibacillus flagellatus]PYI50076.1 cobalamin biosynthesis protein CbiX [Paenibacillus flagellatus]
MGKAGVLVISHGSRSTEWVKLVDGAVADVRLDEPVPVVSSFLEIVEGRLIQDGIDALEAEGVTDLIVVPLFVSKGSTHVDEIRYALGDLPAPSTETDLEPFRVMARVHMCEPLDDDPIVADMVLERLRGLSSRPDRERVLLVGHGSELPEFYARWKRGMGGVADRLREAGGFADVRTALLLPDETRDAMRDWLADDPDGDILVAPLFLSTGYFTEQVIPQRLEGFRYRYDGAALLPHPSVSRWMERTAGEALRRLSGSTVQIDGGMGRWRNGPD